MGIINEIMEIKRVNYDPEEFIQAENDGVNVYVRFKINDNECMELKIDADEKSVNVEDDDAMYSFFYELRDNVIINRDDFDITEEEFEIVINGIENTLEEISEATKVPKYDEPTTPATDKTDKEEETIPFLTMTGIYPGEKSSINWDHNIENLNEIDQAVIDMHGYIWRMMQGEVEPDELISTADAYLENFGFSTDYNFPVENVTAREIAILKMMDVFSAYSTILHHTVIEKANREKDAIIEQLVTELQSIYEGIPDDMNEDEAVNDLNEVTEND